MFLLNRFLPFRLFLVSTALTFSISVHAAEDTKDPYAENLTGHWGGYRDKLSNAGVDITLEYKADLWSVNSGGSKHGQNYLDNTDLKFALDNEKLLGIKGNRALVYFINNDGSKPNASRIGSVQGVDNIEVGTDTFKLYEAWDEQSFFDNKITVLVGLHDLNSEFAETDMTANFIKPTLQIGQTFAQSGVNGPSIFPTTSLAARIKVMPTDTIYISAAAFDGVPGNPSRPHGTHIDINEHDGLLLVAEGGVTPKPAEGVDGTPNKIAIGGWTYTKEKPDLIDVDINGNPVRNRSIGAYFLSSYQFYYDKASGHDLGLFLRAGIADGDTAQTEWDYEAGFVGHGWIPTREDGEIGIGFSQSDNSSKYLRSVGGQGDRNEYAYELYYRDKLVKGISIQPDIQYIVNPGTDKIRKDALAFGVRFDINF